VYDIKTCADVGTMIELLITVPILCDILATATTGFWEAMSLISSNCTKMRKGRGENQKLRIPTQYNTLQKRQAEGEI